MSAIDDEQDELIQEFLVECNEGLDKLDQDLLSLEEEPGNAEILSAIFRTFHTIKGTAGFLAFQKLESVAHAAENLLSRLREGTLEMNTGRADALLKTVDVLREILSSIESDRVEGTLDCSELLENLMRLQHADQDGFLSNGPDREEHPLETVASERVDSPVSGRAPDSSADAELLAPGSPTLVEGPTVALPESGAAPPSGEAAKTDLPTLDRAPAPVAAAALARRTTLPPSVAAARGAVEGADSAAPGSNASQVLAGTTGEPSAPATESASQVPATTSPATAPKSSKQSAVDTSIRVDVNLLDAIMNLVGELVLTRNQIMQHAAGDPSAAMIATSQRLNLITSDLQEGVMKTRMPSVDTQNRPLMDV